MPISHASTLSFPGVDVATNFSFYYQKIYELTPKTQSEVLQESSREASPSPIAAAMAPYAVYAPFLLFTLLFIIAFAIQILRKARNWKSILTALVIALFAASIPMVLFRIQQFSLYQAKAGPDEIPRNIQMLPIDTHSLLVTWQTDATKGGLVRFGPAPLSSKTAIVVIADRGELVTHHQAKLEQLIVGKAYEMEVFSGTLWYDNGGKPIKFIFRAP